MLFYRTHSSKLDIGKFCSLLELCELRLRGVAGLNLPPYSLSGGLNDLAVLESLTVLVSISEFFETVLVCCYAWHVKTASW